MNKEPGWITVAAGKDDYQKSLGCGMCVEIKGDGTSSLGGDTGSDIPIKGPFKATVIDLCGGCNQGDILSMKYEKREQQQTNKQA